VQPKSAIDIQSITNKEGHIFSAEDVAYLKSQGLTDEQIAELKSVQTNQVVSSSSSTALIYVDNFLGRGKTGFPADIISIKKGALKFKFGQQNFDYSGNFAVLFNTPRHHKNPSFGFGKPETAKFLSLGDFFKDQPDGSVILPDATIWEKSDGFVDAEALGKEWIFSGNYTITN
jgi:hypothetical protein